MPTTSPSLRIRPLAALLPLALLAALLAGCRPGPTSGPPDEAESVVATIDGEPVSLAEFRLRLREDRAGVYDYFQSHYGIGDGATFWHGGVAGITPLDFIKEQALRELTRIKVQQLAARRAGLIGDVSYAAFLQRLQAENARRAAAMTSGVAVYGPPVWMSGPITTTHSPGWSSP